MKQMKKKQYVECMLVFQSCPDADQLKRLADSQRIQVDFSIILSPTYSVPVLWFSSNDLRTVTSVHNLLLAAHLRDSVRSVGIMGGISRAVGSLTILEASSADKA